MSRSIGGIRISDLQSSSLRYHIGRLGFSHLLVSLIFLTFSSCKQALAVSSTLVIHISLIHHHNFALIAKSTAIRQPHFDRLWALEPSDSIE